MQANRRNDVVVFLATGCFTGFLPRMPGTWGTFAAIPLVILTHSGGPFVEFITASLFLVTAVWLAGKAEVLLGSRDASQIVIDEMFGFVISLLWLPLSLKHLCLGFVFFRFFDIVKPPPIAYLEVKLPGGWSVVLDDALAGVYTNIGLRLLLA
ncbi:MAG: phosphatidylglycerophosphatase A [Deltaproteobacteria bacterium]|nr:MAG: phosphatidylglycerophosphatase A [Deltaproteobacteria bacterium]